jgi:hypothetical protein
MAEVAVVVVLRIHTLMLLRATVVSEEEETVVEGLWIRVVERDGGEEESEQEEGFETRRDALLKIKDTRIK